MARILESRETNSVEFQFWRPSMRKPPELPENVDRVAIYFAMRAEGMALVEHLGLSLQDPLDPCLPAVWYRGAVPRRGANAPGGDLEVAIAFAATPRPR